MTLQTDLELIGALIRDAIWARSLERKDSSMSDIHEIGQEIVEGMRRKGYSEEMIEALVDEKVWEENRTPPPELLSSPSPHTAILSPCCSCALEARLRTPICRQYRCLCCDKFYIWSPGHWESA